MSKPILVTGGAGFIGRHLIRRLLEEGREVVCLDNLYTGRRQNVEAFSDQRSFSFVEQDVRDPFDREVEEIYHLACPASPIHYQKDRVMTTLTCVVGTDRMLALAERSGARILFASTSEVYGDPTVSPQPETYRGSVNPNGVRSCYDEGKRAAESLMLSYHDERRVDIRIARIFNTYGPYMDRDDGRVVSNFIVQALSEKPITVYGDGNQTRSFCYVSDMVEGLTRLMKSPSYAGPTNLGNPDERPVSEIARIIKELAGSASPIVFEPLPPDDPKVRCPDITKARRELGWEPVVPFEEGVKKTIDYFRGSLTGRR
jgi:UDP-glucuronate decarboxylase